MTRFSITICIECENLVYHPSSRLRRSLAEVGRQVRELCDPSSRVGLVPPVRILIGIGSPAVSRESLETFILEAGDGGLIQWEIHETPRRRYYEIKNALARMAASDIVVFLDSDVIPEPGWLEGLITPFEDEATEVIAGATYTTDETLVTRGASLWWFFPPRGYFPSGVRKTSFFYANNVALRRAVALEHPFDEVGQLNRGACSMLALSTRGNRDPPVGRCARGASFL